MARRKLSSKSKILILLTRSLTPSQQRACSALLDGDKSKWSIERKRVDDAIFKLRASYDGTDERWTGGMINHYSRVLHILDTIMQWYKESLRSVRKGLDNGKRNKQTCGWNK